LFFLATPFKPRVLAVFRNSATVIGLAVIDPFGGTETTESISQGVAWNAPSCFWQIGCDEVEAFREAWFKKGSFRVTVTRQI
jgi:hypothetical protein